MIARGKKLIEVALPLEAINKASVRENYIYRGNPSAMHAEQARIVRLLVDRVDLGTEGLSVRLRADGLQTLVEELQSREAEAA